MPASILDPVNAALRTALANKSNGPAGNNSNLDEQLAGASKKALLADIEFEQAGSYQTNVLEKLKNKYIVLKSDNHINSKDKSMGRDETLTLPKHELFPLNAVQLGWNSKEWSVGAGMVNMGNTCYLNSTLQALFHVPALVNWLISDRQHVSECEDSGIVCIICAMRKTLQDSQQRNTNSIRPFLIYNKLRIVCRNLIPGRQEDAHEFLRYLVEAMEKSYLNRFKNNSQFDSRTKETTPLNQILGGYLRSTVRCLQCGHVSTTFQHFQDLLLDIRKAQTLEEALDLYFSREQLDDDSYHCEACQKKVPATKQFSMERAPMVLCIQLKRFSVTNNKITKHVQFKQRLELSRYARHRPNTPLLYRLSALVTHMGPTVSCGHYTAVGQAPCGNFYQFDDSMVRPISHQAVFSTNAYIMLYELEQSPHKINGLNKAKVTNGVNKVYGPELPPKLPKLEEPQHKTITSTVNGKNEIECESTDVKVESQCPNVPPVKSSMTVVSSTSQMKLVPYDEDDDSSSDSNSNGNSSNPPLNGNTNVNNTSSKNVNCTAQTEVKVSTKAANGEWKVTSSTDNTPSDKSSTVNDLLKMSHGGYSAPVSSWNGTRAQLDKEISNEKRDDRKRTLSAETDQGRVKHVKTSNNGTFKSNPGYNPVQEYHNAKNWTQNGNSSYRQFYNPGGRHRRRNNFHHKNYHKSYRFRP